MMNGPTSFELGIPDPASRNRLSRMKNRERRGMISELKKTSRCSSCKMLGHWRGDLVCCEKQRSIAREQEIGNKQAAMLGGLQQQNQPGPPGPGPKSPELSLTSYNGASAGPPAPSVHEPGPLRTEAEQEAFERSALYAAQQLAMPHEISGHQLAVNAATRAAQAHASAFTPEILKVRFTDLAKQALPPGQILALSEKKEGNNGRFCAGDIGFGRFAPDWGVEIWWPSGTSTRSIWPSRNWYVGQPIAASNLDEEGEEVNYAVQDMGSENESEGGYGE
eukprot:gnl/TRDRNA2_/TRDRNA2_169412_c0_seq1.p1 gnl/TRDRNA2_/TRDRNA2_169412_c0~~gnl/TRDRNA2_/TRDRNA2_169412_c0_seq1.p1  ORF type:complete len:278 (+),score=41.55 gnl/TRDRNA2_/TRDRNA2_169412_c0_seq1:96-929(+)